VHKVLNGMKSGIVVVNGTAYYYEEAGAAGHPVVLLHSGLANCRMWDREFATFAEHFRVIRYDLPGFGRSATPSGEFSTRADLAGLLRALGVQRAHVVGLSLGGSLGIDFAIEYPDTVSALVAVAPGLGGSEPDPATVKMFEELQAAEADQIARDVPGARKVVFPKVAHLVNLEQPELFSQTVLEFLQSVAVG
jgi:3-oxoadipate enol-lactonase